MHQASTTITTAGDIGVNIDSFRRHLAAENLSPRTVTSYLEATGQFAAFLADKGMPEDLANIKREHVESFITHLLDRWKASTANNRYRFVGTGSIFSCCACCARKLRAPPPKSSMSRTMANRCVIRVFLFMAYSAYRAIRNPTSSRPACP